MSLPVPKTTPKSLSNYIAPAESNDFVFVITRLPEK